MNENPIRNVIKFAIAYAFYYSGLLKLGLKLFVRNGLYAFNYHYFCTFVNDYWVFGSLFHRNYQKNFEKQVQFFSKYLLKIKSLQLCDTPLDRPYYMLTFDDGYKDNVTLALPILTRYEIPTVFFIVTGVIGKNTLLWHDSVRLSFEQRKSKNALKNQALKSACKSELKRLKLLSEENRKDIFLHSYPNQTVAIPLMMDWADVRKAHEAGVLVAPHTHTHPILAYIDLKHQEAEIGKSIKLIESKLGIIPRFFSYPEGSPDLFAQDTIRILKNMGIKFAFTTDRGVNRDLSSPFHLKRVGINPSDPIPLVALKILIVSMKR